MLAGRSSTARTRGSSVIGQLRGGEERAHLVGPRAHAEWLLEVAVEAGPQDPLAVVLHVKSGNGDDGDGGGRRAAPQLPECLYAVDAGQLGGEQDPGDRKG